MLGYRSVIFDHSNHSYERTAASEQRLRIRLQKEIDEGIVELMKSRVVTDMTTTGKVRILLDLAEPTFRYDRSTGQNRFVVVGNPQYRVGDKIPKPSSAASCGAGGGAGNGPDTLDDFLFEIKEDEFRDAILKGLKLPNMEEKIFQKVVQESWQPAGYRSDGPPATLDLVRTTRYALGRRRALHRPTLDEVAALEADIEDLEALDADDSARDAIPALLDELHKARAKRHTVPWLDPKDKQHRRRDLVTEPVSEAVMFCIMDVSGSMTEQMKKLAKRFFWLQRFFLAREYRDVHMVWIRHTTHAQEVDEETFFHDPLSGGTNVESALQLMLKIQKERFPVERFNIYCSQASDGDAGFDYGEDTSDAVKCALLLHKHILPMSQYFAYIECHHPGGSIGGTKGGKREYATTELWEAYESLQAERFAMRRVDDEGQIYQVFRGLFSDDPKERKRLTAAA